MAYTDAELVRKMISDPFKTASDDITTDDESPAFFVTHKPVKEGSLVVSLNNTLLTLDTDFTFDYEQGLLTLDTDPSVGQLLEVKYEYSVFSVEEIDNFLALDGSVNAVVLRLIDILLSDSARRFDYSTGQENMSVDQVFQHLKDLRKIYADKIGDSTADGGNAIIGERSSKYYPRSRRHTPDLTRDDDYC